jgi:hypothetical protein
MPQPFYTQGNICWYPLDRRLGGPQSCSGYSGEEKNSQEYIFLNNINMKVQFMGQNAGQ